MNCGKHGHFAKVCQSTVEKTRYLKIESSDSDSENTEDDYAWILTDEKPNDMIC